MDPFSMSVKIVAMVLIYYVVMEIIKIFGKKSADNILKSSTNQVQDQDIIAISKMLDTIENRVNTLETIISQDSPNWRKK